MRKLSPATIAKFSESGFEPVILVRVFWQGGDGVTYSDKLYEEYGFEGKLIQIGVIDDVVNVNSSSSSASVSVTLDDTDGTLKSIFNTTDIHKTKVRILQWSSDLPTSEIFVLFTGQISSPIEWKEGDRTLSFDVVTLIEDRQVGFSVEDGRFKIFPSRLIGQAWPILFGNVIGVPVLQIIEAPSGIIAEGIGIVNQNVWDQEFGDLAAQRAIAITNAQNAYLSGVGEAITAGRYKGQSSGGFNFSFLIADDPEAARSHDAAAQNYFQQAVKFGDDANSLGIQIGLKVELMNLQLSYDKTVFRVNTINMPEHIPLQFKLGSATYYGTYANGYFNVSERKFPEDFNRKPYVNFLANTTTEGGVRTSDIYGNGPQQVEFGQKFHWADAGTEIHVENFPLTFVVSVGVVAISAVNSYKRGIRVPVPSNYYVISYQTFGNTTCTLITLVMPLTARTIFNGVNTISEGWDGDSVEVDAASVVGPNTVDILTWLIVLFTKFSIDTASFNFVKAKLTKYPMNFASLDRKNVVQMLQEIAYQARCSIWLNGNTFFIRYLPIRPTPTATITDDDIILNSLVVTCTDTENIITSYTATWKPNLFQKDNFKIIYKYNIPRYGFRPGTYDYYAYNQEVLVQKSAEFWMIRNSNSFKILRFKTALHKISIETFDAITIDIEPGLVCNGPVVGTVLKATYNSQDNTIDIDVWLPIRFGEMTIYKFAEPFNESTVYPLVNDPNIKSTNPFELAGIFPQQQYVLSQQTPFVRYEGVLAPSTGRYKPPADSFDNPPGPPINSDSVPLWPVDPSRIGELFNTNNYLKYKINPITVPSIADSTHASFPGIVRSTRDIEKQLYNVDVFYKGLDGVAKNVVVRQFVINFEDEITPGTAVEVRRGVWRGLDGFMLSELWMQATIWQPNGDS